MKRLVLISLIGAFALATTAALAALTGTQQYTWSVKNNQTGAEFDVTFNEDGTYTTSNGLSGTWELKGGQLCVKRSTGEANCIDDKPDAKPGDSWQSEDAAGNAVTVTLKE